MFKIEFRLLGAAFLALFLSSTARSENVSHWNLDGDLSSSSGGEDLILSAFEGIDPSLRFVAADIDGAEVTYPLVPEGNPLTVRHGLSANGGGSVVHDQQRGPIAGPCAIDPAGKACYIAGDLDMHSLRVARKWSRMLHQRRPELARETLGKDWATSEVYADYPG